MAMDTHPDPASEPALETATALASAAAKSARSDLIAAAAETAAGRGEPGGFVRDLFGRVPPEDLGPYPAEALADLAARARAHLAEPHRPGEPASVRLHDVTVTRDGRPRDLTLVEAVNDNRPFLLDSCLAEMTGQGLVPLLVAHPILGVERDGAGALLRVVGETTAEAAGDLARESLIQIHLDRLEGEPRRRLEAGLAATFADVAVADADRPAMLARLEALAASYGEGPTPLPADEIDEARAFLWWLLDGHFTVLGLREHGLEEDAAEGESLGVLRDPALAVLRRGRELVGLSPEIRAFLAEPQALIISKASVKSRVHRAAHLDYVGIKLFSDSGALAGELRVVGLFTASAYTAPAREVPVLRRKVAAVVARAGLDPTSHAGRGLIAVLETYPRDDLYQIDVERLTRFALAITDLADRPRVRVLSRIDRFGRFVSLLVYVPKDRYDTRVRARIGAYLAQAYGGRLSASYADMPEGPLARLHVVVGLSEGAPERDPSVLEAGVGALVRTWADGLRAALAEARDGAEARRLFGAYAEAFGAAYRENFSPEVAVSDIAILERLSEANPRAADLGRRETDPDSQVRLKVFSRGAALALSDRVPALENMGFRVIDERTYRVTAPDGARVWLHDMLWSGPPAPRSISPRSSARWRRR